VPHVRADLRHRPAPPPGTPPGDKWHLDEVFITIAGKTHYLWRAVDQHGAVLDILLTSRRDARAASRFFRTLLKGRGYVPRVLLTDTPASYPVAHRRLMPGVEHRHSKYLNNRTENSNQPHQTAGTSRVVQLPLDGESWQGVVGDDVGGEDVQQRGEAAAEGCGQEPFSNLTVLGTPCPSRRTSARCVRPKTPKIEQSRILAGLVRSGSRRRRRP